MAKIISLLGFMMIYFSTWGQKASYYIDPAADLNKFAYFYMPASSLDAHELTNPFLVKNDLNDNNRKDFVLYNELSLKNMTLLDGHGGEKVIEVYLYEGSGFVHRTTPLGYRSKKLKGKFLILDVLNSANETLIWRGWIDLKKIKGFSPSEINRKAIIAILTNLKIEPVITE